MASLDAARLIMAGLEVIERHARGVNGGDVSQDAIGSLQNAYSHATATGLPSYEFVRFSLGDGPAGDVRAPDPAVLG